MEKMKVLSPAGSIESFYVALNNGADEIYMGINAFNARAKAVKNDLNELKKAITDAHILGAKVFCTLNTLIFENELESVANTIVSAINLGFDAFIVQDLAVVKLIKAIKEDAVIHLSTQLGLHNSFGAIMAKELGASRIVLSREASLDDIKAIKKAVPDMEIEYFVQGALCVAFSGNCYLSNRLLGKSGNRGECAQLCRLPYTAEFGEQLKERHYYLSPADLALYKHLNELKDAGVTSLKIEGRLRSISYIGTATHFYRNRVDELYKQEQSNFNLSDKNKIKSELMALKTSFNRGDYLDNGYLDSTNFDNIIYKEYQNHIGIPIGSVVECEKFKNIYKIKLKLNTDISKNDGLKMLRDGKEVASLGVGNVEKSGQYTIIYSGQRLSSGDEVRLINSSKIEYEVINRERKLKLNIKAEFILGREPKLTANIYDKEISVCGNQKLESAKNAPLTKEDLINNLSKLNGTVFELGNLDVELDNVFITKSALNELRRNLIDSVIDSFNAKEISVNVGDVLNKINEEFKIYDTQNAKIKELNLQMGANTILSAKNSENAYFLSDFNILRTDGFKAVFSEQNDVFYIFLPPFLNDRDIKTIYDNLLKLNKDKIVVIANNIGQMYFAKDFNVVAGDFCNITNHISSAIFKSLGASGVCLGYEIAERNSKPFNYDYKINGNSILCFLSHCPYKAVTGTTCKTCKFNNALTYKSDAGTIYHIKRYRASRCYFYITQK